MIADLLEIKAILGKETTYLTATNVNTVVGVTYRIFSNSTGDFTNIGAVDNNEDTTFIATGVTPTSWGDGVLQVITAEDLQIEMLIPYLTSYIVEYTQNPFTDIEYITDLGYHKYTDNSYRNSTFTFTTDTISDSSSGLDFLDYKDFMIVGQTRNFGYFTVKTQTAASILIEETFETETNDNYLTLYGVRFPKDLAQAMAWLVSDELDGEATTQNAKAESIGKYSVTYAGSSSTMNSNTTTYNTKSINILNRYRKFKNI